VAAAKTSSKRKRPPLVQRFFRTEGGNEPVRDWLKALPKEVRQTVGADLTNVQEFWPASNTLPLVGSFGGGLYEVRSSHDKNIYRVLFCFVEGEMFLLHGFHKKSQKTPSGDLDLARERQALVKRPTKTKTKEK
jgi:phage-related protein